MLCLLTSKGVVLVILRNISDVMSDLIKANLNYALFVPLRNARKKYHISLPDHKFKPALACESTGQETVLQMIKNRFMVPDVNKYKVKFENMLLKNENGEWINSGLPAGALSTTETYGCEFKKNDPVYHPSDYLRDYAVNQYSSNWEMGHFVVSKVPFSVCKFTRMITGGIQVDFFKDETIFEALVRDKRFVEKELRCCGGICDMEQLPLSVQALNYQGRSIEIFVYSPKKEDLQLPVSVPSRPHPDACNTNIKVEESKTKKEMDSALAGANTVVPLASSTPVETSKTCKALESRENLAHLIECAFEIKSRKITTKEKKKLAKECHVEFHNFALKHGNKTYVRHLRDLCEISKSVGVIFMMDDANCPEQIGTCFRIGTRYIITNNHVMKEIEKKNKTAAEVAIFLDFKFMEGEAPDPSGRRYEAVPVPVVRYDELDFAILQVKNPANELPPCIFSHGISIMDPNNSDWSLLEGQCLTLIGHPYGQPKQTDLLCPVVTEPLDSLEVYGHALRRSPKVEGEAEKECLDSKDSRRGKYHVGSFFHGSSGSPGIVLQNGKKRLVILHTKGFYLADPNRSFIEQGVLFTEVYKHVQKSIKEAQQVPLNDQNVLKDLKLEDIFPSVEGVGDVPMDIGQY